MYRVRRNSDRWKERWPWRLYFAPKINERFCKTCGMPYQDGPMPKEVDRVDRGSVGGLLFPSGGYRKREYVARFGRWRTGKGSFYLSEYVPEEDLADLSEAVQEMRSRITTTRSRMMSKR